ncbi:MAG: hypothetical protein COV36_02165 [Alphaproteobacteria bacterium CG11_big_fil_rev_8_21_14_0_20_44_7]|nr:MAG: hypothetical protein COV36_02165 [Alphaproteobacteria bacterium CG11_big_fil_rev_8_21_14_0_20_44_7]
MATPTVGLKTHIWNNNLKVVLFLLLYPMIITPLYVGVIAVFIYIFGMLGSFNAPESTQTIAEIFEGIIYGYWYVPYLLLFGYLGLVYLWHKDYMHLAKRKAPINRNSYPEIYTLLENLCISRGMKTPYFFLYEHASPNAYTRGISEHTYYIVITTGLLEKLETDELEAVLAHELTHIINRDTRFIFLTSSVTEIFLKFGDLLVSPADGDRMYVSGHGFLAMVPLFFLSMLFKMGNVGLFLVNALITKNREFVADAGAVELTKNPQALIRALSKIEDGYYYLGLNMPLSERVSLIHYDNPRDFTYTHPEISSRIAKIRAINRTG